MSLEESLDRIANGLFAIAAAIARPVLLPPRPEPVSITLISERRSDAMDFLTYEATLPTVPAGTDVVSQQLVVSADGAAVLSQELAVDATTATFEVPEGSTVDLALAYTDNAGNLSPPRTQSFVAQDTIAPDAPGDFGEMRLVSERTVPDA